MKLTTSPEPGVAQRARVGAPVQEVQTDGEYVQAMEAFLSIDPRPMGQPGEAYPRREESYDRPGLR